MTQGVDGADATPGRRRKEPAIPAGRSLFGRILYAVLWVLCRTLGVSLFGIRVRFAEPLPTSGLGPAVALPRLGSEGVDHAGVKACPGGR